VKLANFPNKNQLADGDPNNQFDCVPTCIADAASYILGKDIDGAAMKDAVYGRAYVGGTAASAYVFYCAALGVRLFSIAGSGQTLIQAIRAQLRQHLPVIATEPDPYADPALGWTHVICFYGLDEPPGTLSARDPFGAHDVTRSDSAWASTLLFDEVWSLAPLHAKENTHMGIPQGWSDDGTTLKAPNNQIIVKGFRQWILDHAWDPNNLPLEHEQSLPQIELSNPTLGPGSRQRFRWTTLEWTATHGVFQGWSGQELIKLEELLKEQLTSNQPPQLSATTRQVLHEVVALLQKMLT